MTATESSHHCPSNPCPLCTGTAVPIGATGCQCPRSWWGVTPPPCPVHNPTAGTWTIRTYPAVPQPVEPPVTGNPPLSDGEIDRIAERVVEKLRATERASGFVVTCHRQGCAEPATHLVDSPRAVITHKMCLACATSYKNVTILEMP